MLQMSSNSSTALRMQAREVVSIFGAGYSGYNLTAGVPNAPKMEAESKGGDFPFVVHTFWNEAEKV